jgi:hypothetical protein
VGTTWQHSDPCSEVLHVRSAATWCPQVYENLQPQAFFLKLAGNGAGLASAWEAVSCLEAAISLLNVYYAINGICILLLIARSVPQPGALWQRWRC